MRQLARYLDRWIGRLVLPFRPEAGRILPVLIHSVWRDNAERAAQHANPTRLPQDDLTLDELAEVLDRLQKAGYLFVHPNQLDRLPARQRLCLLTFDDGYAANQMVLPILERYHAPALFSIATDAVVQQHSFWWDAVYRKQVRNGNTASKTADLIRYLQFAPPGLLQTLLTYELTEADQKPETEADRPFRLDELQAFAKHPLVTLGNHTASHSILTRCEPAEMRSDIRRAQDVLTAVTGQPPQWFAYPGGQWNEATEAVVRAAGFRWAFREGSGLCTVTGVQRQPLHISRQPLRLPTPDWPVSDWLLGVRSGVRLAQRWLDLPEPVLV